MSHNNLLEKEELTSISKDIIINNMNKIPDQWYHGPVDYSIIKQECLHQIFEISVDAHPNNLAVVFDQTSITYEELEYRSNKLARYLRSLGVGKGDRVSMILNRSIELYICLLAIMKAGAAYVPMDPSYPEDRILYIVNDCETKAIITTSEINKSYSLPGNIVLLDKEIDNITKQSKERLSNDETEVTPNDLAYIIYTSGSTGRPKGVQIQHRSVCNLVRASQKIYNVIPEDRIYQGFTIAFDASVEEVWMAFLNGAALVPATKDMIQAGMDLPKLMTKAGITVLSCVPTLLSMFQEDIPTLRLLIVGGEDCPQHLISRWHKLGRRMINTYGPTEATVIATHSECLPGKPVTIGRPLTNYSMYILDENQKPVSIGESGELCIGGIGLSCGYVNRDDLTKEKFIDNPLAKSPADPPLLYRSGDLARFNEKGAIEFLGRIDTQVKIRGFRVELSEIETVICTEPSVRASVVSVHELEGIQSLVAYIVPRNLTKSLDVDKVFTLLRERLPAYMIPSYVEIIDSLPTLPSGKVNRKELPTPSGKRVKSNKSYTAPKTNTERIISKVWSEIFKSETISITDNFFNDLGGHSLLAAMAVSKLRENPSMSDLAVSDIYGSPTIEELAAIIENRNVSKDFSTEKSKNRVLGKTSSLHHKLCGFSQAISIYIYYFLVTIPFVGLFLYKMDGSQWSTEKIHSIAIISVALFIAYLPSTILLAVVTKWCLIGRFKEGSYPLWGSYYFRFWLVRLMQSLVPVQIFTGTPLMSIYCRLLGAKVGSNCFIGTNHIVVHDLLTIGDNSSIGLDAHLMGYIVEDGMLKLGKIDICKNCYVGTSSTLSINTVMLDNSKLGEQSMLASDITIPSYERWTGSPAKKDSAIDTDLDEMSKNALVPSKIRSFSFGLAIFVSQYLLELVPIIALAPGTTLMLYLYGTFGNIAILSAPLVAISFNLMMIFEIAIIKKLFLGKIEAGQYELYTSFYYRKWFVDKLMDLSLSTMHSLYATIYTAPFLRLLGTKIGKKSEVSTVSHISPNLLSIGDECFLADATLIGTPKIFMGFIKIAETKIGKRTFIGNSALVPINKTIGDNCLIGVLSVPPQETVIKNETSWLGSPAIFLPRRDINKDFSAEETYSPTLGLYIKRYIIEFFRVILPLTIDSVLALGAFIILGYLKLHLSIKETIAVFPIIALGLEFFGTLFVVLMKVLLIGKYKSDAKPLWSTFVWRSELVTALYETITVTGFLSLLTGTPFINCVLRLFGVKIGSRVFMDTTYISEFDLVDIGDDTAVNHNSTLQTHLFEDRVMKMSNLKIGENCSVGTASVVLYDTEMKDFSAIGSQSLLMKGESLPTNTEWHGIPVKRCN